MNSGMKKKFPVVVPKKQCKGEITPGLDERGNIRLKSKVLVFASQPELFGGVNGEADEVDIVYLDFKKAFTQVCFKGS